MRYYSDKLGKFYDTAEACQKAEFEAKEQENRERIKKERAEREAKEKQEKLAVERKARAAEVEDARKAMITARKKYFEALEAFTRDYGSFHLSLTGEDARKAIPTLFDNFFDFF